MRASVDEPSADALATRFFGIDLPRKNVGGGSWFHGSETTPCKRCIFSLEPDSSFDRPISPVSDGHLSGDREGSAAHKPLDPYLESRKIGMALSAASLSRSRGRRLRLQERFPKHHELDRLDQNVFGRAPSLWPRPRAHVTFR